MPFFPLPIGLAVDGELLALAVPIDGGLCCDAICNAIGSLLGVSRQYLNLRKGQDLAVTSFAVQFLCIAGELWSVDSAAIDVSRCNDL